MAVAAEIGLDAHPRPGVGEWLDRHSGRIMVLPAVLILLCFAIFPLIVSAYLALSRFALAPGGFTLKFVGLLNLSSSRSWPAAFPARSSPPCSMLQWA
jgi:multiple sugar transport system permease protein